MAWQRYTLIFRLLSPLHIGYRKVGNLMQTRPYVPGKVLWAALTARLTRDFDNGSDGQRYIDIGKAVNGHFRFGYLYPALPDEPKKEVEAAADVTVHYPWGDPLFDYRFLSSYAGTALNYDYQSAEEGTLREVEFIRPHARPVSGAEVAPQVYLVGDLYVEASWKNGSPLQNWQKTFEHIQLGGERHYGWGRVQLVSDLQNPLSEEAKIKLENGDKIPAHALAVDPDGHKAVTGVTGAVEPLVGWERDNESTARKWRVSQATICYVPGAEVTAETTFSIGTYGIWEAVS
jgi:hypothetical protein